MTEKNKVPGSGSMLWEAGIVYMAEGFTVETTKSLFNG